MSSRIKKALTRRLTVKGPRGKRVRQIEVEPSERLVYGLCFAMLALIALTAVEIVHIIYIGSFSSEIFSAITALIGTITGIFISQKT